MSTKISKNKSSIFIHSLFRSGSTYVFNVFRRSDRGYYCYQEPLNEQLNYAATDPELLLDIGKNTQKYLRHPKLDKPYFYEFYAIADEVGRYFRKEFSYDQYFTAEKGDYTELKDYFMALQNGAQGLPVFQCCRTSGRVAGIKSECGGVHIFLWRNPWDQWWSYKKGFETNNLLIYNAKNLSPFLMALKKEIKLPSFHDANIFTEYEYFKSHRLDSTESYTLYYALWCHAMLEAKPHCELEISIDKLSSSNSYRNEVMDKLVHRGIDGLDFSDCSVPMAIYGKDDGDFFLKIENHIHELLLIHGYSDEQVNGLKLLCSERQESLVDTSVPENSAVRDSMRAREYLQQIETEFVGVQRLLLEGEAKSERLLLEAETKAEQLHIELHSVYVSRSWLITKPLRWCCFQLHLLNEHGVVARSKALIKRGARSIVFKGNVFLTSRPRSRATCIKLLQKTGLYSLIHKVNLVSSVRKSESAEDLTPRAHRIYHELKSAIEKQKVK